MKCDIVKADTFNRNSPGISVAGSPHFVTKCGLLHGFPLRSLNDVHLNLIIAVVDFHAQRLFGLPQLIQQVGE